MGPKAQLGPITTHIPKEGQLHGPSTKSIYALKGLGRMIHRLTKPKPAKSNPWKAMRRPRLEISGTCLRHIQAHVPDNHALECGCTRSGYKKTRQPDTWKPTFFVHDAPLSRHAEDPTFLISGRN